MKIILSFCIAFIPGLFWIWYYLRKDREKPEPPKMILKIFFYGMAITIPAIAFEFAVDYFFPFSNSNSFAALIISSLFVVAPIEELLKYFVLREGILKNRYFDESVDGVIYAVVAGLGFATLENILVVFGEGNGAVLLRFATATLMHALASGIVGYHIGLSRKKVKEKRVLIFQGLIIAILFHALYNISVSLSNSIVLTIILLLILLGSMFLVLLRGIKELKELDMNRS